MYGNYTSHVRGQVDRCPIFMRVYARSIFNSDFAIFFNIPDVSSDINASNISTGSLPLSLRLFQRNLCFDIVIRICQRRNCNFSISTTNICEVNGLTALLQLRCEHGNSYGGQYSGLTTPSMKSVGNWRPITAHTPFSLFPPFSGSFHPYAKKPRESVMPSLGDDHEFMPSVVLRHFQLCACRPA